MKTLFPTFFFGHGSPMSAIEQNEFSLKWQDIGKNLEKPKAILGISAHFETNGTFITSNKKQKTIYDFYGFPEELYNLKYEVSGDTELANEITKEIPEISKTNSWGIDHGIWSILVHMFPDASIPVLELSIDFNKSPQEHFELGKKLKFLRQKGVLVIGSGNIVHNLREIDWYNKESKYNWAEEFNENVKKFINEGNFEKIIDYKNIPNWDKAIQGKEHFLPLLYILALKEDNEKIEFFNDKIEMGSLSMTSIKIGE